MVSIADLKRKSDPFHRDVYFKQYSVPFVELECVTTDNGRWYVSPNGTKLTSVTTMLGRSGDHTWLEAWRDRLGHDDADKETQRCADRGEGVHLACELYLKNKEMHEVFAAAGDYVFMFNQLRPYLDKITKVYVQEIPLYSEILGLAGRVDLIAEYMGKPFIIDFKTSNTMKTKSMVEDYSIQLCLYSAMFQEMFNIKISNLANIIANENALKPTYIPFDRNEVLPLMFKRVKLYREMDAERGGIWTK